MKKNSKVVVTTDKRGVFFGIMVRWDEDKRVAVIRDARVCVKWSEDVRGFVGLCNTGPIGESRVSRAAPELVLVGVTSVGLCTEEAASVWESEPWK